MDFGQPERRTHNYVRHGTLDLFAALNVATGELIARCKANIGGRTSSPSARNRNERRADARDPTSSSTISLRIARLP
jgi:hypothetical protein